MVSRARAPPTVSCLLKKHSLSVGLFCLLALLCLFCFQLQMFASKQAALQFVNPVIIRKFAENNLLCVNFISPS